MNTEVVIIGAGPTGLMAACQLARYGISFIIVDTKAKPTVESRAMLVTARSMEIYDQMGIAETILEQGKSVGNFSIFVDGREKLDIPIGKAGEGLTDFPYIQVFEQSRNEELLYAQLKRQGLDVLWNTQLLNFEQDDDHVTVELKKTVPQEESIRIKAESIGIKEESISIQEESIVIQAKYLIGCDGAGSKSRHFLGCKFEGGTYKNKFFVADTIVKWDRPEGKVLAGLSKRSFCAFFPMYGDKSYRVLGIMPESYQNNEQNEFKDLEAVIKSTIQIPLLFEKVNWFSTYQLHHRCVDRFRTGRCFLAGDAAHIHSPAGGQGMNTGLQDAYNISWKLAMVLQNLAGDKLLDTYHMERYPFAKWLLKFTDKVFAVLTSTNILASWFRVHLAPLVIPQVLNRIAARRRLFRIISQIWYSYNTSPLSMQHSKQQLKFRTGDRFPYVKTLIDGELKSCYHLLKEPKFHFVIIGGHVSAKDRSFIPKKLDSFVIVTYLPLSKEWGLQGVKSKLYILVRPDNYIGLLSDDLNENTLLHYFDQLN